MPGFQSVAAYALIPVGTVAILLAALRSPRRPVRLLAVIVAAGLACNTIAWAITSVPDDDSPLVGAGSGASLRCVTSAR